MNDGPAEQDPSSEAVRQRLAARIAGLEERSTQFGANLARFAARMDARFDQIDARFDQMHARFDRMEERLDASIASLDSPFGMVNRSIDRVFRLLLVVSVAMAVVLAKGFQWI